MALSLSLLSVIILIFLAGALIFADVSFGILGSMSSTYLIRPVSATTDEFGDCIQGPVENNPLPCVIASPGVPGASGPMSSNRCGPGQADMGMLGCVAQTSDTTTTIIVECRAPYVNTGGVCVRMGPPPCQQGFNCPGDPGAPTQPETPQWNPMDPGTWDQQPPVPCNEEIQTCANTIPGEVDFTNDPEVGQFCAAYRTPEQQDQCERDCAISAAAGTAGCLLASQPWAGGPVAGGICETGVVLDAEECYRRCDNPIAPYSGSPMGCPQYPPYQPLYETP